MKAGKWPNRVSARNRGKVNMKIRRLRQQKSREFGMVKGPIVKSKSKIGTVSDWKKLLHNCQFRVKNIKQHNFKRQKNQLGEGKKCIGNKWGYFLDQGCD